MTKTQPGIPELQRVAALHSYRILDTPPDEALDDIVDAIRMVLHVPIAYIGFVDSDRQWFKARRGLDVSETSREVAFCAHTILGTEPLLIPDTVRDPRFRNSPFVVGDPQIRFYMGVPIVTPGGAVVGTVCALDTAPRPPQNREVKVMRFFARQVLWLMDLHRYRAEALMAGHVPEAWEALAS